MCDIFEDMLSEWREFYESQGVRSVVDLRASCPNLVVLRVRGSEVACFALYRVAHRPRDAFLSNLFVPPALRGRGIGSRLLSFISEKVLKPAGYTRLLLVCEPRLVPFYTGKHKFVRVHAVGHSAHRFVMAKPLCDN